MTLMLILLSLASLALPPISLRGDFDYDGDIDQSDFGQLQVMLGNPAMPHQETDLDGSGAVDAVDVEMFEVLKRKWEDKS